MVEIRTKILPSTEKCFLDDNIKTKPTLSEASMLRNERFSFQFAYTAAGDLWMDSFAAKLSVDSELADKIKIYKIEQVPVTLPTFRCCKDEDYLRKTPGLYPDLLIPRDCEHPINILIDSLAAYLFVIEDKSGIDAGVYTIGVNVEHEGNITHSELKLRVVDAMLPKQKLMHTEWFHCDCIADFYKCEVFSERYWELVENYMVGAVECGINMLYTPVFNYTNDIQKGYERTPVQLVDIELNDGKYSFGYKKLERYIKTAISKGIEYFEICHFFAQWGTSGAPQIYATVDGEYKMIFGWDTDALGAEYSSFLREFTASLIEKLKELNIDKNCIFHIFDEPPIELIDNYKKAKEIVGDLLEGYTVTDALAHYEFYENGLVSFPICDTNVIGRFIEKGVKNLFAYYCCGQYTRVSNRFIAMPGRRTRILGTQLYKFKIKGFLQWGFNFWNSRGSVHKLNPYIDTSGDFWVPAGDTFAVYPGDDGKPLYTLHSVHFFEALQDLRAFELLEDKIGYDKCLEIIESGCAEPITFTEYPRFDGYIENLREKINAAIAESL